MTVPDEEKADIRAIDLTRDGEHRWSGPKVPRHPGLTAEQFLSDYVNRLLPVVVPNAVSGWPALTRWTPEWFAENYGSMPIGMGVDATIRDVVALIDDMTAERQLYARNIALNGFRPDLSADISPSPPHLAVENWLQSRFLKIVAPGRFGGEVFIGPAEARFPYLHWDSSHVHANFFMIHGVKEIVLFAPDQAPFLYPVTTDTRLDQHSMVSDVYEPDLEQFPKFSAAQGTILRFEPGDHLFVPGGWWHAIRSLTPSISIVHKMADASNWEQIADDYPQRFSRFNPPRPVSRLYLRAVGAALGR